MSHQELAQEIAELTQMIKKETREMEKLLEAIQSDEESHGSRPDSPSTLATEELDEKLKIAWGRMKREN